MKQDRTDLIKSISTAAETTKRAMQALFYRAVEELGLSVSHAHLLMLVKQVQPVQLKDLASRMYITPGAITQSIEGLCKEGYLLRTQDEQDRRSVFVSLTEKGTSTVNAIQESIQKHFNAMLSTLTDEELALYQRAQQKLLEHLESETSNKQGGTLQCR